MPDGKGLSVELFDSLERQVKPFVPAGEEVSVYVCGITPYDTTHLGHAFAYTAVDILIRYLEHIGHKVRYVQNVTDIDDDILRRAEKEKGNWLEVGNRWTAHFIRDMVALNIRPPDHFPRATDVISEIITSVQALLEAGVAYHVAGSVYFDLNAWPEYGKLSCLPRAEMLPIANERGNFPDDPNKRDPLDFVLWQAQKPGEPAWDSPWGPGRPGWHIECSTLADHFLNLPVDIHSGGEDLIFPHHESEIAQSEPLGEGKSFVRYWVHVAMVRHEGEKMSKSLGNLVMVNDLLNEWSPDALRVYLAMHHYRSTWSHDPSELESSERLADKLRQAVEYEGGRSGSVDPKPHQNEFFAAMDQDLDTPSALAHLENLAEAIMQGGEVSEAQSVLRQTGAILGLRLDAPTPEEHVQSGWSDHLQRFADK
jgi:L-cysteine:1D-myo-inositol 2-amino-2-deoxy-alpha-D-glucopyranoside ligase